MSRAACLAVATVAVVMLLLPVSSALADEGLDCKMEGWVKYNANYVTNEEIVCVSDGCSGTASTTTTTTGPASGLAAGHYECKQCAGKVTVWARGQNGGACPAS